MVDSNSDDFLVEEYESESPLPSNNSVYTDQTSISFNDSTFTRQSSSILSDSLFEEAYTKQLDDRVRELKAELRTHCPTNWLTKFVPAEQNPKIELNLLLHGAIRERTIKQLALSKNIQFRNDETVFAEIFQMNDLSLLQRIIHEIVNDQRQQNIIYTEIIFRPDVFNFSRKAKLKDALKLIIDSIRLFTSIRTKKSVSIITDNMNTSIDETTIKSSTQYAGILFPTHIKLILSCNWNNVKNMSHFIRLAREYPEDIIGIDFYGEEDNCRKYWHEFSEYTKILNHYQIPCQVSMASYQDLQLIDDVIKGLRIERISEPYEIILSTEHLENLCMKHAIHLIVCPLSNAYSIANSKLNNKNTPFHLINQLQLESISFSIGSFSPFVYQQNLSCIYKNLFSKCKNPFTCEHMQLLNENAIRLSFACQKLKTELMDIIRENYRNCYKQTILFEQFQVITKKWHEEMCEIIDKNAQTAVEFAKKMHKEKILKRINRQQENQSKIVEQIREEEEETSYQQ